MYQVYFELLYVITVGQNIQGHTQIPITMHTPSPLLNKDLWPSNTNEISFNKLSVKAILTHLC